MKDLTIVGGGPVGLFGAFYAGLRGMSVRVVDSLEEPGGQLVALYPEKFIYDMPGFPEVLACDLARDMVRQVERFQTEWALGVMCKSVKRCSEGWLIGTVNGDLATRTIVICAGVGAFTPTKLDVEREDEFAGKGLTYGVRDKESLRGKCVVVIGGGDSALDWALGIENIASHVTLVHRRDGFRAHEESVRKLFASTIETRLWETVTELHGNENLTGATVTNKKTQVATRLDCDALVVNIGFKSSLGPLKTWGLEIEKNKIVVNAKMETNLPGIYAAGDVCTHEAKLDLIATGVGEVCTAVNFAKTFIDPEAKAFPGHSTDMDLPPLREP